MSRVIPYAAGGLGLAALENRFIGENLPDELKNVNLGIGATSGALAANPKQLPAVLGTLPFKQLGLFGIGSMDRLRRQQQDLVDTNLTTAKINQRTARIEGNAASSKKLLALLFLAPAMAAGGGIAYHAWDQHKKRKAAIGRYKNVNEEGKMRGKERIRIDVPTSAVPAEFFNSLGTLDDNEKAFRRLQRMDAPEDPRMAKMSKFTTAEKLDRMRERKGGRLLTDDPKELQKAMDNARALFKKENTLLKVAHQQGGGLLSTIGSIGADLTGVPSIYRSVNDTGSAMGNLGESEFGQTARYGAGALGGAALGLLGMRTVTLPLLGKLLTARRLAGAMKGTPKGVAGLLSRRQFSESPTMARMIYPHAFGNTIDKGRKANRLAQGLSTTGAMDRLIRMRSRYDPNRFAWNSPTGPHKLFNKFLSNPGSRGSYTATGNMGNVGRYMTNRLVDTAYRGKQLVKRYPNLSLGLAAAPLAGRGIVKDDADRAEADALIKNYMPDYANNRGHRGMPVSSIVSGALNSLGMGSPTSGIRDQLGGSRQDQWAGFR